jgi:3-dehydroquinate synthetase
MREQCVLRAIELKVRTVEQDEKDRDVRLLLNFGHTVGHAVEALSEYSLSHGEAVAIGMIAELQLTKTDARQIQALLEICDMPTAIPSQYTHEDLWKVMLKDKKNEQGNVKVAVPVRIGEGALKTIQQSDLLSLRA